MSGLKPWVSNPAADSPFQVAFVQSTVTNPDRGVTVSSPTPGRYQDTVATKSPGAGELKPFAGGTAVKAGQKARTPFSGHKGAPRPDTVAKFKTTPRTVIPSGVFEERR